MLKTAKYRIGGLEDSGEVVYAIFNKKRIVFSGITKPGSTINYAEDIIRNIAAIEGLDPLIYQWFDLQTHLGYHSREPGVFSFSKLKVPTKLVPHSISRNGKLYRFRQ